MKEGKKTKRMMELPSATDSTYLSENDSLKINDDNNYQYQINDDTDN